MTNLNIINGDYSIILHRLSNIGVRGGIFGDSARGAGQEPTAIALKTPVRAVVRFRRLRGRFHIRNGENRSGWRTARFIRGNGHAVDDALLQYLSE